MNERRTDVGSERGRAEGRAEKRAGESKKRAREREKGAGERKRARERECFAYVDEKINTENFSTRPRKGRLDGDGTRRAAFPREKKRCFG